MEIPLKMNDNTNVGSDKLLAYEDLVFDGINLPNAIRIGRIYTFDDTQAKTIQNLNGKYIKLLLSRLEHRFEISKDMRKTILDTMNDYARELHEELGI